MSDDFETRVQRWLRERGEVDPATVESVAGQVAALPRRGTGPRRTWLMTAAAALVIVAVSVGIIVSPRSSGGPEPTPPDPAAFAGDPRLASCFGGAGEVQYAFEMTHARDYQGHLPNMLLAPELDVDDPGFVVVFGQGVRPNVGILGAPGASSGPQTAAPPNHRYVCVFVADTPNLYSDVDIDGLRATLDGSTPSPTSSDTALPDPVAFRFDPRFNGCRDSRLAVSAFEVTRARDIGRYLPAFSGLETQLDTDFPALVVIMGADYPAPPNTGPSGVGPPSSSSLTDRYVCIAVGRVDGPTDLGYYFTSITGFDPHPAGFETTPTAATRPTSEPAPAWAADLAGQLDCDGATPGLGGELGEFSGPSEPAAGPGAALQALLDQRVFASFPASGFEPPQVEGHWARHAYLVDGRRKAMAVTSDQVPGWPDGSGWQVVGIRSCDASEFDPADGLTSDQTLWLDSSGDVLSTETIQSSPGPEHCGWQSVTFLWVGDAQYLRDPSGVLDGSTLVPFDDDVSLPGSAEDTGYHTADWHLFTVPAGDAVYVRTKDATFERWGGARDQVGCM